MLLFCCILPYRLCLDISSLFLLQYFTLSFKESKIHILELSIVLSVSFSFCSVSSFSISVFIVFKASSTFLFRAFIYLSFNFCLIRSFDNVSIPAVTAFSQTVLKSLIYPKFNKPVKTIPIVARPTAFRWFDY